MRIIAVATFCTLVAVSAQAKQVERITATGANAAGVCAGSLDMVGQLLNGAQNPDPRKIAEARIGRDFFADLPQYPSSDIAAAATAFIQLMSKRIQTAGTTAKRESIVRELMTVATSCVISAKKEIQAAKSILATPSSPNGTVGTIQTLPTQPVTVQPHETQPYVTQPLPTQPLATQPYVTQPLILDPIVPAQ